MRILCAGGGSGGHVTPVVAVLDELVKLRGESNVEARFVCDASFAPQAKKIMARASTGVPVSIIQAGKLRRYRHFRFIDYVLTPSITLKNLLDIGAIGIGTVQSLWLLARFKPDVVFAKGGYVCLPVGWAARLLRIPVVIHDSDARPGLTNRLLAPFARTIATGYPLDNYPYDHGKSHYVGVPIRAECVLVDDARRQAARQQWGIADDVKVVVGVGGGLGSRTINLALAAAAPNVDAQITIVAGVKNYQEAKDAAERAANVTVLEFVSDGLMELLAAADVVVTRASATSLQELAGLGKAIIAVPARQLGDQHKNAEVYRAAGAAVVLTDDELEAGQLERELQTLLSDGHRRQQLAEKLHTFARPHAARDVARLIAEIA